MLVERGSDDEAYAERILSSLEFPRLQSRFNFDGWWQDVARSVQAQL